MCQIKLKCAYIALAALMLAAAFFVGCGVRGSDTGSLSGRIVDANGSVVVNALVYSAFKNDERVYSGLDGGFYLGELPSGNNSIIVKHANYRPETRQAAITANAAADIGDIVLESLTTSHKITDISVFDIASESVKISYKTYKPVICSVLYGPTVYYKNTFRETRAGSEHEVFITGLAPASLYHFKVQYTDKSGADCSSNDFVFKTAEPYVPNKPENVRLNKPTAAGVMGMAWQKPLVGRANGYNVYKSVNGAEWQRLNDSPLGAKETFFSDENAKQGAFCRYAITALNELGAESEMAFSESMFVPGAADCDIFINSECSPVLLYGDLTVAAGCTLNVEGPCEFLIADTDSLKSGLDENRVEIILNGSANFAGGKNKPITFGALTGEGKRSHWGGIRVCSNLTGITKFENVSLFGCSGYAIEADADRVIITNTSIAYSECGILLKNSKNETSISNCTFNNIANTALAAENCGKVTVDGCKFSNVLYAVKSDAKNANSDFVLKNTDIYARECAVSGVFGAFKAKETLMVCDNSSAVVLNNLIDVKNSYIDHCTIDAYNGIIIKKGLITIENNIIVCRGSSGSVGINNKTGYMAEYAYNNVYGFSRPYEGCLGAVGAIAANPMFVGAQPFSYELSKSSSLLMQDKFGLELGRYGHSRR